MALLQILLLLLYALPTLLLPITSNPLGLDDTPDNLAFAALSLHSRTEHEGVRKIPKSIFIAPHHHLDPHSCPNGYKLVDGKCSKEQNFEVNQLALITSQFQQFLDKTQTTTDYDDYDYGSYGDSTESGEPLHIPLSVSFDDDTSSSNRDGYNDGLQNMPFLSDNLGGSEETTQKKPVETTTESKTTTNQKYVVPTAATVAANADRWPDDHLGSDGTDGARPDEELNPTTLQGVVLTTPDYYPSTTQKKALVDVPENVFLDEDGRQPVARTTVVDENESFDGVTTTLANKVTEHIELTTTTENDFDRELQSESLFKDDSVTGTTISMSDGTTEMIENDVEVTTELPKKIVAVPTVEQVQIVTPVQQQTTTGHSTTHRHHHHHRAKPTTTTTTSTTQYNGELQTAERLDINESMMNRKLSESIMKHELNEDAIETIDANNRFVYTHLDAPSNEPDRSPSTTAQSATAQRGSFDFLRLIGNNDSRKNNRIRFPDPSATPVNIFSNFKGGTIKFPGPVQQRTPEPLYNRLIPDLLPKKPPESAADRPLFSWLPAGTTFDFNRNAGASNSAMRFWNKLPLIRDRSATSRGSSEPTRSNSKSPTDSLYKDASVSEVYKVIASKNYKHDNR